MINLENFTWQPIETIPRDGTPVLVWAEPMDEPDIAWHESSNITLNTYTHWMSLPKPPNSETSSKQFILGTICTNIEEFQKSIDSPNIRFSH